MKIVKRDTVEAFSRVVRLIERRSRSWSEVKDCANLIVTSSSLGFSASFPPMTWHLIAADSSLQP
jgi:hypothetical protein